MYRYFFNNPNDESPAGPPCTVSSRAQAEGRYITHERYGHVLLAVEPWAGEYDLVIEWRIPSPSWDSLRGGERVIPYEFHQAICKGVCRVAFQSEDRGPLSKVKVSILGGSYHIVNSSDSSYMIAATMALVNALKQTELIPLEG